MMKPGRILVVLCVLANSAFAQQRRAFSIQSDHPLSSGIVAPKLIRSVADTLKVLAIMVDFPTDQDTRTSGNGKFQLQTNVTGLIDPPPHDSTYFANKFRFVENYFRKVSNGQLIVRGDVLDSVITVGKPLADYAPTKNGNSNRGLANLAIESWRAADSLVSSIPFSQYECFVVFHAGVGHDIDVVGFLGFDPTPDDLPSLYLSLKSFQDALADPSFPGIVTRNRDTITNTIVLPETETRVFTAGSSSDTVKLSMNGLTAASIGSHLGLPDLFDTKTGRQGIGQFGLMDGASIFAYSGLFPPEPSAWEKVYLGWVSPITVSASSVGLPLPAVGLTTFGQDTIYKIPINASEYFLVENRNRDPQNNGQNLTIFEKGIIRQQGYNRDTTGFSFDNISAISGSIINVEDFDWALIGSLVDNESYHGGGILVWHIDERVINAGLASNTVNADPNRRGVDLEEADGSQDIGQVYDNLEPGAFSVSGSPLDCWFDGNAAKVYGNVFDRNSFPNSNSNSGARSLLTIKDFSKRAPRMSLSIQIGDEFAKPLAGFPKQLDGDLGRPFPVDLDNDGKVEFVVSRTLLSGPNGRGGSPVGKGAILAWRQNGNSFYIGGDPLGVVAEADSPYVFGLSFLKHPISNKTYIAAVSDGVYLWKVEDLNSDFRFDRLFKVTGSPVNTMFVDTFLVAFGGFDVTVLSLQGVVNSRFSFSSWTSACRVGATDQIAVSFLDSVVFLDVRAGQLIKKTKLKGYIQNIAAGDILGNGTPQVACFSEESAGASIQKHFFVLDSQANLVMASDEMNKALDPDESIHYPLALADLNGDGKKDVLAISSKGRIIALNSQGFFVDTYPRSATGVPTGARSSPLVADIDGDNKPEVLFVDYDGTLRASSASTLSYNVSAKLSDFTLASPALFPFDNLAGGRNVGLISLDVQGMVKAFDLQGTYSPSAILWPMLGYDLSQGSFASIQTFSPKPISTSFLPKDRTYNWPNPVYGNTTNVRYYVSENADVSIKIFDLAGAQIAEILGKAQAGVDGEVPWDVSNIQSGIYLARIEAVGTSKTDVVVIKIAVVK